MRLERHEELAILRMELGKANAMGWSFIEAMDPLLDQFEASDARALIITGRGTIFSGGLELPALLPLGRADMAKFIGRFGELMIRVFQLDRPVVAAINGHAVAGGCVLALQCDYRIMTTKPSKIGLSEAQLGIGLPAGVIETLRAQVPVASLLPLALQGELVGPERAAHLGLVQELAVPEVLEERAIAKARKLGSVPRVAYGHIKRTVRGPVMAAIESTRGHVDETWLDTWFSEAGRAGIGAMVAKLAGGTD